MSVTPHQPAAPALTRWTTTLLAVACGIVVANLYYAQPLIGPIGIELGMQGALAGLIVTLTQLGYVAGLIFIVPLGDRLENRRLVVLTLLLNTAALATVAIAGSPSVFLAASLAVGLCSVVVQIMVPFGASLAPEATRGRVVGNIMGGVFLGIMLARPVASLITDLLGWRAVFVGSAVANVLLTLFLARALPRRKPVATLSYARLLQSLWLLLRDSAVLRRRALYHVAAFATFSLFWTTAPLLLAGPRFGLSQSQIALFSLAGVAGAVSAPVAGRLADRGLIKPGTLCALILIIAAVAMSLIVPLGSSYALAALVITGIVIDLGVSANLILGQRVIFSIGADVRSRVNGIYMALFFLGGAAGSAIGVWAYTHGGWTLAMGIALALPVSALAYFLTEK